MKTFIKVNDFVYNPYFYRQREESFVLKIADGAKNYMKSLV